MSTSPTALPTSPAAERAPRARLHSGNAGMIVHRVGQTRYGFHAQAREFAHALSQYMNQAIGEYVTTLTFEEIFGTAGRLHWLVHMKAPNDYGRILKMVDHDTSFRQVADADRLPAQGGGSWERLFTESSFQETIIVPQHGLDQLTGREGLNAEEDAEAFFASPARHQTPTPADRQLHSGNAGAIIHRRGQLKYEFREEGRTFAFEWQDYFNRHMADQVTVFLYEEGWGSQDRIHLLIHLKDLDQYKEMRRREDQDDACRAILARERISAHKGGGTWGRMFVEASLQDTVIVPSHT